MGCHNLPPPTTVSIRAFYAYKPDAKPKKHPTAQQLRILKDAFTQNKGPLHTQLRRKLASATKMNQRSVEVWFQNRRAKEKSQASNYTLPTEAISNYPNSNGASSNVKSSSPPSSHTPTSSECLLIANRTLSHYAANKLDNPPIPFGSNASSSCALPHATPGSDLDLCCEDVSSICYGPLSINMPSQRNWDPLMQRESIVDGCRPSQLTLHHDYDANAEVRLSHSHSTYYRYDDISAQAQYGSSTWVNDLGTSLSPLEYHATPFPEPQHGPGLLPIPSTQFGATSGTLPILGAANLEHDSSSLKPLDGNVPSLLNQSYSLATNSFTTFEPGVNNDSSDGFAVDNVARWISTMCSAKYTASDLHTTQPVLTMPSNEMLPMLWSACGSLYQNAPSLLEQNSILFHANEH